MSADLTALIPNLQPFAKRLVNLAGRAGVGPRVTSTLRTYAEQQRLYAAFLRGETQYPVAPPGTSSHEYGFAFDMIVATQTDLHDLGTVWRQAGGIWNPTDEVHFEYPGFRPPAIPQEAPPGGSNLVAELAEKYADVPWYVSLFLPTAATVSKGSFANASHDSPGARFMCRVGFQNFC